MADNETIPVWLDCDPGHDDAFAMLILSTHPGLRPLGISTTHGNSSLSHTTLNALRLLTSFGPLAQRIPVHAGASQGLVRPAVHAPAIHGESGLDGTDLLPSPAIAAQATHAVDAMATALLSTAKGTAWVVATGALTNLALAFEKHPALAEHVRGVSIMGGAVGGGFTSAQLGSVDGVPRVGNWSLHAEFNILADPEAAAFLLSHPVLRRKTTLVPLDVSHLVLASPEIQSLLKRGKDGNGDTKLRRMLVELLTFFADTYREVFGITVGPPLHDPIAMAIVLNEVERLGFDFNGKGDAGERFEISVVTEGSHDEAQKGAETGKTNVKLLPPGEEGIRIPRDLEIPRFWAVVEECLARADADNAKAGIV